MAFSHSRYTDARGGAFNDVGHDQINTIHNTYNISISLFPSGRTQLFPASSNFSGDILRLTSAPEAGRALVAVSRPNDTAASVIYTAVGLIVQITALLLDCRDTSKIHLDWKFELTSLQNTLTLTGFAIQEYDERPLGRSLANTITPEVERCRVVLQELLDKVNGTWQGLKSTSISKLWTGVWCSRWDGDEMVSLRKELFNSRKSLERFLVAFQSIAWMNLGNKLHAGHHVSLKKFHDLLNQRLPFLGHIKVDAIQVVNHLGDVIPVPNMFCSTWEDFHYIINGYCKNTFGNRFVERGDYKVLRAADSQIIDPTEFASRVESGMVLEMSIVLRQKIEWLDRVASLLASSHTSTIDIIDYSRMCPGRFQVENAKENEEVGDGWSNEALLNNRDQPQNDTQFFPRFHVICMDSNSRHFEYDSDDPQVAGYRGMVSRKSGRQVEDGASPLVFSSKVMFRKSTQGKSLILKLPRIFRQRSQK